MNGSLFLYNLPESISKHWQLITDDVKGNAMHLPEELGGHIGGTCIVYNSKNIKHTKQQYENK